MEEHLIQTTTDTFFSKPATQCYLKRLSPTQCPVPKMYLLVVAEDVTDGIILTTAWLGKYGNLEMRLFYLHSPAPDWWILFAVQS